MRSFTNNLKAHVRSVVKLANPRCCRTKLHRMSIYLNFFASTSQRNSGDVAAALRTVHGPSMCSSGAASSSAAGCVRLGTLEDCAALPDFERRDALAADGLFAGAASSCVGGGSRGAAMASSSGELAKRDSAACWPLESAFLAGGSAEALAVP